MAKQRQVDGYKRFKGVMNVIFWTVYISSLIVLNEAKLETQTIFDNRYAKVARTTWLIDTVEIAFGIMIGAIAIAILGLIINLALLGEKKRKISLGLLIGFIASVISVLWMYIGLLS